MKLDNDIYQRLQATILTSDDLITDYLSEPPAGTIAERIAIYADGYFLRLEEALKEDFQALSADLGENKFSKLVADYISFYPSSSYSLQFLGQNLSKFLQEEAPYNKQPYLAEIAAYEWAETKAFIAADANFVSLTDMQNTAADAWPDLKFFLHPSCQILEMHWSSFDVIKAIRTNTKLKPIKLKEPQSILLWRNQDLNHRFQICYCLLTRKEQVLVKGIQDGLTFIELCELVSDEKNEQEVANFIVGRLYSWIKSGLFVRGFP